MKTVMNIVRFALFLVLLCLLSIGIAWASSDSATEAGSEISQVSSEGDEGSVIASGSYSTGSYRVHWEYKDNYVLTITSVGELDNALSDLAYKYDIRTIIINEGITSIGDHVFEGYDDLVNIELPSSLTSIGNYAFANCENLDSIKLPFGLTSIGSCAFNGCKKLSRVELPSSLTNIGSYAFSGCENITDIKYSGTLEQWLTVNLGSENQDVSKAVLTEFGIFDGGMYHEGQTWMLTNDGVLTVSGEGATGGGLGTPWDLYGDMICTVVIDEGITTIDMFAFRECKNLTSVKLPASLTYIGPNAFQGCEKLVDIEYAGTAEQWAPVWVFRGNSTICTTMLERFGKVGGAIDENLTWTLTDDGVLTISGAGEMAGRPWDGYGNSICSVVIEEGVTSVSVFAFEGFGNLTSVVLPASIDSIGSCAFRGIDESVEVEYGGTSEQWATVSIEDQNEILVAAIAERFFKEAGYISGSVNESVQWKLTSDGELTISGQGELTITLTVSMKDGGATWQRPWDSAPFPRRVVIEEGITSIGGGAFYGCGSLESITIPSSVTDIGSYAFDATPWLAAQGDMVIINGILYKYCGTDSDVVIPSGVTSINWGAFSYNRDMVSVTIPASVEIIKGEAFNGCDNLADVYYGGSETDWDSIRTKTYPPKRMLVMGDDARWTDAYLNGITTDPDGGEYSNFETSRNEALANAVIHFTEIPSLADAAASLRAGDILTALEILKRIVNLI